MRHIYTYLFFLVIMLFLGCASEDDKNAETQVVTTSFSGTVLYESTMEPVTNGELSINGIDTEPLRSPQFPAFEKVALSNGSFDVTFETIEEVDKFSMLITILDGDFIVSVFGGGDVSTDLICNPFNCRDFEPGKAYELTIFVPCDPDDCIQFPPN